MRRSTTLVGRVRGAGARSPRFPFRVSDGEIARRAKHEITKLDETRRRKGAALEHTQRELTARSGKPLTREDLRPFGRNNPPLTRLGEQRERRTPTVTRAVTPLRRALRNPERFRRRARQDSNLRPAA